MPQMPQSETDRTVQSWERHAQSIALALIIGAVMYTGSFIIKVAEESSATKVQITTLIQDVARLTGIIQAMQLNTVSREEFHELELRIRSMERDLSRAASSPSR